MDEMSYQQQALAGATGIELIVALYDGLIRFLYRAMQCVEENDVHGRRVAVKKALDVLMYLQARLRPDVGGIVAASLADFYSTMFTMTLEASHLESKEQFQEVISLVRNVREAWVVESCGRGKKSSCPLWRSMGLWASLVLRDGRLRSAWV
jgi:flagellar protein FliS